MDLPLPALLGAACAVAAAVFVLSPLARPAPVRPGQARPDDLAAQRAAIYRQILDLEFDLRTGKLSEPDFREQSEALLARAAELLAQAEGTDEELDRRLEQEIAAARAALARSRPASPHLPIALALLLSLSVSLLLSSPAHAQSAGLVEGRVVNGTAGAGPPQRASVSLYRVRDRQVVASDSQQVDEQGHFRFDGLEADPSLVYLLVAEYQGIVYPHPQLLRLGEQPRQAVELRVYETTSDARAIAFERANMLVLGVEPTRLEIMEMGAVTNSGDRTYVGDQEGVLRLSLPAGATDVVAEAGLPGDEVHAAAGGVATSRPLVPGRHQVAVRYSVPISGRVADLGKQLDYPVEVFTLYLPLGGLQASSPQLQVQTGAPVEMGGGRYQVYTAQGLPAGTRLSIRISGLPSTGWQPAPEQIAAASLGGVLLLAAGAWLLLRRGGTSRVEAEDEAGTDSASYLRPPASRLLELERRRLVLELADLDERFAAGELPEEDYRARRGERKQRLLAIARQLEEATE